jgi:hypothetical protein
MVERVEILWMNRAFPVEDLTAEIVFWLASFQIRSARTSLRSWFRLIGNDARVQFMPLSSPKHHAAASP